MRRFPLRFSLTVSDYIEELDVPLVVNRQFHMEDIVYRQSVLADETQVAYVTLPTINFLTHVKISSDFDKEPENREGVRSLLDWITVNERTFVSDTDKVSITNRIIFNQGRVQPLFYGMKLEGNITECTVSSPFRDNRLYAFYDADSKTVFSNMSNYWNESLGDYRGITINVSYSDRESETLLFSSSPVYTEATFSDYDLDTFELLPGRTVYEKRRRVDGKWEIKLSGSGPWYVQNEREEKIYVEKEELKKNNEPWLLKIREGSFEKSVGASTYKYKINEYDKQVFFPRAPYVTMTGRAIVIDKNLLLLDEKNILLDPGNNIHLSLVLRDANNNLVAAYSTSRARIGRSYNRWDWDEQEIRWEPLKASIDYKNGVVLVDINRPLLSTDNIQAQYVVEEKFYRYRKVNLNPVYNKHLFTSSYLLYVKPNLSEEEQSVFYLRYENSKNGYIVEAEEPEYIGLKISEFLRQNASENIWNLDLYSEENDKQLFVLCTCSFISKIKENEIKVTDIRLKSGVKPRLIEKFLAEYPEAFFYDVYSHKKWSFPDKKNFILSVDRNLVLEKDNDLVKEKVRKNLDIGSNFFLENSIEPRIKKCWKDGEGTLYIETAREPEPWKLRVLDETSDESTPISVHTYTGNGTTDRGTVIITIEDQESVEKISVSLFTDSGKESHRKHYKV